MLMDEIGRRYHLNPFSDEVLEIIESPLKMSLMSVIREELPTDYPILTFIDVISILGGYMIAPHLSDSERKKGVQPLWGVNFLGKKKEKSSRTIVYGGVTYTVRDE